MPKRKARTQPQERPHSEHPMDSKTLRYEVDMLVQLATGYSTPAILADRRHKNAYIEAFAIHSRALILFLFQHQKQIAVNGEHASFGSPWDTDIIALDFCSDWANHCSEWGKNNPKHIEVMIRAKNQTDKHVVHFTTSRRNVNPVGRPEESSWDFTAITSAICSALECLLTQVRPTNIDPIELDLMRKLIAESKSHSNGFATSAVGHTSSDTPRAPFIPPSSMRNMHGKTQ